MATVDVLDLDAVVRAWAAHEYDEDANFRQRFLKRRAKGSHLGVFVDWSKTSFVDRTTKFPLVDDKKSKPREQKANGATAAKVMSPEGSCITSGLADKPKPTVSVLFQTKYRNKTSKEQQYTLRTEKKTRSAFSVETESSYTRGMEMSVTLKTPCEILEVNAGYKREYSLTRTSGHEFEEEMTWGVESVIHVDKERTAMAKLVVFEERKSGSFEIDTEISGRVSVVFTNTQDNNSFVMSPSQDISKIIEKHMKRKDVNIDNFVRIDSKVVHVITRGQCGFQYGVRQKVQVDQVSLADDDEDDDDFTDEMTGK